LARGEGWELNQADRPLRQAREESPVRQADNWEKDDDDQQFGEKKDQKQDQICANHPAGSPTWCLHQPDPHPISTSSDSNAGTQANTISDGRAHAGDTTRW
jgi:hypothetical protein